MEDEAVAGLVLFPLAAPQVAAHGVDVGVGFAEGVERFVGEQQLRGFLDLIKIQAVAEGEEPGQARSEGVFGQVEEVFVAALRGVEAGVRFGVHGVDVPECDIGRQELVEAGEEALRELALEVEVQHVLARVHARVGAPAAGHLNAPAQDGRHRGFDDLLHAQRVGPGLPLPAGVAGPAIGEVGEVSHFFHQTLLGDTHFPQHPPGRGDIFALIAIVNLP